MSKGSTSSSSKRSRNPYSGGAASTASAAITGAAVPISNRAKANSYAAQHTAKVLARARARAQINIKGAAESEKNLNPFLVSTDVDAAAVNKRDLSGVLTAPTPLQSTSVPVPAAVPTPLDEVMPIDFSALDKHITFTVKKTEAAATAEKETKMQPSV